MSDFQFRVIDQGVGRRKRATSDPRASFAFFQSIEHAIEPSMASGDEIANPEELPQPVLPAKDNEANVIEGVVQDV